MGWSQQNANEFPDVYTTRTIQSGDINMTHLAFKYSLYYYSAIDELKIELTKWLGCVVLQA